MLLLLLFPSRFHSFFTFTKFSTLKSTCAITISDSLYFMLPRIKVGFLVLILKSKYPGFGKFVIEYIPTSLFISAIQYHLACSESSN